jgi:hypothetical protein
VTSRVIQVSTDQTVHNAFNMDHQALPPTDLYFRMEPAVDDLLRAIEARLRSFAQIANPANERRQRPRRPTTISIAAVAAALKSAVGDSGCLIHLPLGWSGALWARYPLDFIGSDGGGGIGAGPG